MAQEYYYSTLSGPQLDAALMQVSQAAGHAASAAADAAAAKSSALAAEAFAAEANGYSEAQSDLRFAPAIVAERSGTAVTVTDAASAPVPGLRIFGGTALSGTPAADAPVTFQSRGGSGSITVTLGGSTLAIPTEGGLPGIPVYSRDSGYAANYTAADGQKWICDEIDLAGGVYIQRIFKIVLDGTENWTQSSSNVNKFAIGSNDYAPLAELGYDETYNDAFHLCSHFRAVGYYAQIDGGVWSFMGATGRSLMFWHSGCAGLDSWKAYLAAQAAAGTPVTLLLRRHTPVETALDAETLAAFRGLRLENGAAVTNDAAAHMTLRYIADTKTYIDQKLAAISAAMLNS